MCWSKYEREQWERERREAERLAFISTAERRAEEPEPEAEIEEREKSSSAASSDASDCRGRPPQRGRPRLTLQTRAPSNSATGTS